MADLKAGTTIGGTLVWTQGNFPLFPTGNSLIYKTFTIYSTNDKPQAADNDFVSKAQGGTYSGALNVADSINLSPANGFRTGGIVVGNGDNATIAACNIDIVSWYGVGFKSSTGARTIAIDTREGTINTNGFVIAEKWMISREPAPTNPAHLTRKDYVDGLINNVTSNANDRVSKAGDTMRGNLTAPNFISLNDGTQPQHVVRYSQVVLKGTILDYGTF